MAESTHRSSKDIALLRRELLQSNSMLSEDFELSDVHAPELIAVAACNRLVNRSAFLVPGAAREGSDR
jgi:hypothetical protein